MSSFVFNNKRNAIRKDLEKAIGLHAHVCKSCGKTFECRTSYAYKKNVGKHNSTTIWFCSYTCMRSFEKEKLVNAQKHH